MSKQPWAHLYKDKRWIEGRIIHLKRNPLCVKCLARGITTAATVVHHDDAHRGDERLFFNQNNWRSLCNRCHDAEEQSAEVRGYGTGIGDDGWPADPRHLANGGRPRPRLRFSVPRGLRSGMPPCTLVCGPPAAGKTTYAREHMAPGDVLIDIDEILVGLGYERWTASREHLLAALRERDVALRRLRTPGWITLLAPSADERSAWVEALGGGKVIMLVPERRECHRRVRADPERRRHAMRLAEAIDRWYQDYTVGN